MKSKIMMKFGFDIFIGLLHKAYMVSATETDEREGEVKVLLIETKEDADSTLICQDGAAILIDTGKKQDAEHILEVLKQNKVEKLDCLILTHSDDDHIGSALKILNTIPVERVVESPYEEATEEMLAINACLEKKNIPIHYPGRTWHFTIGRMHILVYPPLEKHYNDNNNYSLAVLVQHEKVSLLFAGDALRKRSEELMLVDWPEIALYKVPHHGRKNVASAELFDRIHPEYGLVTAKSADCDILQAAEKNETKLLFTLERDIRFISDGEKIVLEE